VRQRLNVFSCTFGDRKLAEITVEELAAWLRDPTWSACSQIHYRRRVSMLYDFGIKHRWCEVNIATLPSKRLASSAIKANSAKSCATH